MPIDHDTGTTPKFKIVLNNFWYIFTNLSEEDLVYSFLLESIPTAQWRIQGQGLGGLPPPSEKNHHPI